MIFLGKGLKKESVLQEKELSLKQVRTKTISEVEASLNNKNIKITDLIVILKEQQILKPSETDWKIAFNNEGDFGKLDALKNKLLTIIDDLPAAPSPTPNPRPQPDPDPSPDEDPPNRKFQINKTTGSYKGKTNWVGEDWEGKNRLSWTSEEPEYSVSSFLPVSSAGTEYWDAVISANFLPNGSALMMETSGELKKGGIEKVIHAANGSPTKIGWSETGRTFKSTSRVVQNAIILAERGNYNKIAIPYLGGNSWIHGDDVYRVAQVIINAALNQIGNSSEVIFVVSDRRRGDVTTHWDEKDSYYKPRSPLEIFQKMLVEYESNNPEKAGKGKVMKGDITDFSLHQCPVIVNHLNMEGKLNGKISQAIVRKLGKSQKEIENDIKQQAQKFNKILSN